VSVSVAGRNMVGYLDAKGTENEKEFDLAIESKSNAADFCTKVDIENESLISNGIKLHFPTHDIIGEEGVGTGSIPALHPTTPTWIIDPIDGTTNFNAGLSSLTCVSIGFCHPTDLRRHSGGNVLKNRPVMGVVYAPGNDDLYVAVKGYGAYRNNVKIYQNKQTACKTLQTAVIGCEFGYSRQKDEVDAMLGALSAIMLSGCRAIRQLGSGVLDLCLVASGRLDLVYSGIVNEGWKPWDYAAGLVICEEAGCFMESLDQERSDQEFDLYGNSVIAAVSRDLIDETKLVINFC
jgi:myo-inositol-1(or 4)-monophosphatase